MKKTKQAFRYILIVLPLLPLVMFIIPNAFTMLSEPTDPWYTEYTSVPFLFAAMYVYPVTAIASVVGAEPFSLFWWPLVLIYAGAISFGIYRMTK